MLVSMALCLLVCCLVLFFLFPRSITLTPVSVLSVMVYFSPDSVDLQVTVSEPARPPVLTLMLTLIACKIRSGGLFHPARLSSVWGPFKVSRVCLLNIYRSCAELPRRLVSPVT